MKFEIKGNYFNGKYHKPPLKGPHGAEIFIKRECPADINQTLWEFPVDYNHADDAVESSISGFKFWRNLKVEEKISFLKNYQEQVLSKKGEIAQAISLETGKPLWEAEGEVNSVIGKVDITINDSLPRINNQSFPNIMPDVDGKLYFKPLGPVLIIGAFNFPCHLANTQILSALIAGNSVILKPSEKTSYSAQLLVDCFHEARFPNGVINLVQGDGEMSKRVLARKEVKGIYFTGSKEVGLSILRSTHSDLSKLVALELGGKNPAIIHQDANIDLALEELIRGCYLTSGQRCTSTSLVAVHRTKVDEFVSRFHQYSKRVIIDHPIDHQETPLMGPLIDKKSLDSYLLFMGMAKREGIQEVMRGKQLERKIPGYYVSPSIHLAEKFNPNSHFLTSEIFGPNCTVIPYDTIEEAIQISNSTEYGLAACVFTKSQEVFQKCALDIETGLINWNRSTCGASPKLPFGGVKNSGNYHPMAVASIDACVYQMASLEIKNDEAKGIDKITGIRKD
jgi:succinylglutamic semialdehyde dehydrogenase